MAKGDKKSKLDKSLKDAVAKLLKDVMADGSNATLTDKCRVVDRALKLAAIEAKMDDPGFGSGFSDPEKED